MIVGQVFRPPTFCLGGSCIFKKHLCSSLRFGSCCWFRLFVCVVIVAVVVVVVVVAVVGVGVGVGVVGVVGVVCVICSFTLYIHICMIVGQIIRPPRFCLWKSCRFLNNMYTIRYVSVGCCCCCCWLVSCVWFSLLLLWLLLLLVLLLLFVLLMSFLYSIIYYIYTYVWSLIMLSGPPTFFVLGNLAYFKNNLYNSLLFGCCCWFRLFVCCCYCGCYCCRCWCCCSCCWCFWCGLCIPLYIVYINIYV